MANCVCVKIKVEYRTNMQTMWIICWSSSIKPGLISTNHPRSPWKACCSFEQDSTAYKIIFLEYIFWLTLSNWIQADFTGSVPLVSRCKCRNLTKAVNFNGPKIRSKVVPAEPTAAHWKVCVLCLILIAFLHIQ